MMKEKIMKQKIELPKMALRENPDKILVRIYKSDEPTLKADLIKTLLKIKKTHPKAKGLNINWLCIQALRDFIDKYL
jgi:hypothetical protein